MEATPLWLEAIAPRLEAMALWLEAIAPRLEAIALRLEAIALRLEVLSLRLEAITLRLEAIALRLEAMTLRWRLLQFFHMYAVVRHFERSDFSAILLASWGLFLGTLVTSGFLLRFDACTLKWPSGPVQAIKSPITVLCFCICKAQANVCSASPAWSLQWPSAPA